MKYALIIIFIALAGALAWAASRWRRIAAAEPRVILTGGGTGGHVNPALAIAEGIRNRDPNTRFLYVGVRGKAEEVIVRKAGIPLTFVSSAGFPGLRPSIGTARFLVKLSIGVIKSVFILLRFAPRWVIATGGYVSAPIILATLLLKLIRVSPTRIFLHEQNSVPGQLNSLLGKWADTVLLTFPQTLSFFPGRGVVVGYPIRGSIAQFNREEALARLGFSIPEGRKVVFAFGGSGGARTINRAVVEALPFFAKRREGLFIIHGMGLSKSRDYDARADTAAHIETILPPGLKSNLDTFYYRQDYFHNIADIYSVSDLIVCRSGAGSLNEISRLGKPALLIPKANLPGDHQVMNARTMQHGGAAELLFEDTVVEGNSVLEKIDGGVFADRVLRLLDDPEKLRRMSDATSHFLRRRAVERILNELYDDRTHDDGSGHIGAPFRPILSNHALLKRLTAAYAQARGSYDPLTVVLDEGDLAYYRHRAAGLLSHKVWQDRNLGVKLIGLTKYQEKTSTLLHMLSDRTPASRLKRLFGGDFRQVGFIRRNIIHALQVLDVLDPEVERHILAALEDPYFEVRVQACLAAEHFGRKLAGNEAWFNALLARLHDGCFEVAIAAARSIGEVGADGRAVEALLQMNESHYWQVRDAALNGLKRLIERGVAPALPELLDRVSAFVLTATDFRPHFAIKETYRVLKECTCAAVPVAPVDPVSSLSQGSSRSPDLIDACQARTPTRSSG